MELSDILFDHVIAKETTLRTFKDTDAERNLIVCENADDMFKKLGISFKSKKDGS